MTNNNDISGNFGCNIVTGNRTNNIHISNISIDIERLANICDTNIEAIVSLLEQLDDNEQKIRYDDTYIGIEKKNAINGLESFYEKFIKEDETKLEVLDRFFQENNLTKQIEKATKNIRMSIFSYKNRETDTLTPEIFNQIICQHTQAINNDEHKEIMELIIFYLYRYCYIGDKNGN